MLFRLYIDEIGNHDLESSRHPNERYLSLTGVILEMDEARKIIQPRLEVLKHDYFGSHPDEPIILHRKELVNKKYPFHALRDPLIEAAWNADLLECLTVWHYRVITVTIDKLQHLEKYAVWHYHPYHYCLEVLLERYVLLMERLNGQGDVIAESRGKREDEKLKSAFTWVSEHGSGYVPAERIQARLTSRHIKLAEKKQNVCGLQLADLIAHPSYKAALARRNNASLSDDFGGKIARLLEAKHYYRSPSGRIDGYGRKWLP